MQSVSAWKFCKVSRGAFWHGRMSQDIAGGTVKPLLNESLSDQVDDQLT